MISEHSWDEPFRGVVGSERDDAEPPEQAVSCSRRPRRLMKSVVGGKALVALPSLAIMPALGGIVLLRPI
jgi:hypothetical protein